MAKRIAKAPLRGRRPKRGKALQLKSLKSLEVTDAVNAVDVQTAVHEPEPFPRPSPRPLPSPPLPKDQDSAACLRERKPLTRKNLVRLGKMITGVVEGSGSYAAPDPHLSPSQDESKSRTTSTTMGNFPQQLCENKVLFKTVSKPPTNLNDIRTRLVANPSGVLVPPTESAYQAYVDTINRVRNETSMMVEMSGLLKKHNDKAYNRIFNHAFTAFPRGGCGFNNELSPPQPDFIEGLNDNEFHPFPIRNVRGCVLYKNKLSVALPHLAGEWKGPSKNMEHAELQSAYDGAALVYARNRALAWMGTADPPGHAAVLTFTTDGSTINIFAHYAVPEDGYELHHDETRNSYHQYLVLRKDLIADYESHEGGLRGLWNAQDYAKQQSYTLRDRLQQYWTQQKPRLRAPSTAALLSTSEEAQPLDDNVRTDDWNDDDEGGGRQTRRGIQISPAAVAPRRTSPRFKCQQ